MNNTLAEKIYSVLVHRKFRAGALPGENAKKIALRKIEHKLSTQSPISIFQFWGGNKNPNLPIVTADLSEQSTLNHLQELNNEVTKYHHPGLSIFIFPGDARVEYANKIPQEHTRKYVESLCKMTDHYRGLFEVVPVSLLCKRYEQAFQISLQKAQKLIRPEIHQDPNFDLLLTNASKNIFKQDLNTSLEVWNRSRDAAREYIIYRLAEEDARIFRDYDDCIRGAFIKFSLFFNFYQPYLCIEQTQPRLDCVLHFYTGGKGNITQPWQAIGQRKDNKVLFLSQQRLQDTLSEVRSHSI